MKEFITSDSHFHHKNILEFEDRPYESLEEMHEKMIEAWNSVVGKGDKVFHLGDFVFGGYDNWVDILSKLNGDIVLIKGNHCSSKQIDKLIKNGYLLKEQFYPVGHYMKREKLQLWMTHYPMEIGNRPNKVSLHGHIHSNDYAGYDLNQINVGVDGFVAKEYCSEFNLPFGTPIDFRYILDYIHELNPIIQREFLKERNNIG